VSADETGTAGNKYLLWRWHHIDYGIRDKQRDRERSGMFKEVRKKREIGNLSLSFIVLLDRFVLKSVLMTTHFFSFVNFFFPLNAITYPWSIFNWWNPKKQIKIFFVCNCYFINYFF
jgi:hypothetical protein